MPINCPVCQSGHTTLWKHRNLDRELTPEDVQITDSRYGVTLTLHRCGDCSFVFADPAEMPELVPLYEQLADPGYERGAENRSLQMRWLLQFGRSQNTAGRTLLEIGAGAGLLVAEARRMGLDAVGVEPSKSLVEMAKRLNGVELINGIYPHQQLAGRQFDFIYLVDVIEHLSDPVALLTGCAKALAPGGIMIVVTPNLASLAAKLLGHRWWHFRLAHVGYFDHQSMREACRNAGLQVRAHSTVRWFFPIRYLAERLSVYLPIGFLNRAEKRIRLLGRLYDRVVPLNLFDSAGYVIGHEGPAD